MKKLFKIFAMAAVAFTVAATTGCDVDADFGDGSVYSVDNIPVKPRDWVEVWDEDRFGNQTVYYAYANLDVRELTQRVIDNGEYATYFKFINPDGMAVQKPLPHTEYFLDSDGYWEYTLDAEYSEGILRIVLRTNDHKGFLPEDTFYFRLAIMR